MKYLEAKAAKMNRGEMEDKMLPGPSEDKTEADDQVTKPGRRSRRARRAESTSVDAIENPPTEETSA
jgi:hypothetical protein